MRAGDRGHWLPGEGPGGEDSQVLSRGEAVSAAEAEEGEGCEGEAGRLLELSGMYSYICTGGGSVVTFPAFSSTTRL